MLYLFCGGFEKVTGNRYHLPHLHTFITLALNHCHSVWQRPDVVVNTVTDLSIIKHQNNQWYGALLLNGVRAVGASPKASGATISYPCDKARLYLQINQCFHIILSKIHALLVHDLHNICHSLMIGFYSWAIINQCSLARKLTKTTCWFLLLLCSLALMAGR